MAVLKQIKFGTGNATPIAQTIVTAASGSVLSVNGTNTKLTDDGNPSYEVDLRIDNATLVKSTDGEKVLKVGTVPAAQVSVDKTAAGITSTNAQAAFKELKDDIDNVIAGGKTYSIVDDTENVEALPANVLKRYRLQETVDSTLTHTLVGEPIDILKDNSLLAAKLSTMDATWVDSAIKDGTGAEALVLVYKDANGNAQVIHIDVSAFLKEAEFKDGLQVNGGVVSVKLGQGLDFGDEAENKSIKVKIDSTSESFLTVGADGVKLAGVQDAIDAKVAALDVTDAAVEGQYVAAIQETDGIVSVKERKNVSEAVLKNYAKGSDASAVAATDTVNQAISKLENQVDAAKTAASTGITTAIEALANTDTAEGGKVVTAVSTANGIAQPTKADFAGIKLGGFAQDADATGAIASTDTLAAALNKLENKIDAAADDHTVVKQANTNTHVTVSGTPNGNGGITYTVTENDIASAQALTNEIGRAKSAETSIDSVVGLTKAADGEIRTYANTGEYIGKKTSNTVASDIKALDTKLKEVADGLAAVQYKVNGTTLEFYGMTEHA